jgi:epoxyqueuosine reductase
MINSEEIRSFALSLGADRCGIASVDRFSDAPAGFHPTDIYKDCRSVIVFLKKMPEGAIKSGDPVVYTHTAEFLYKFLNRVGMDLCFELEKNGITAVPVPTDVPYMHYEPERMHGMGILSMRHSARNAGLGILGRNTLLINKDLGNLAYIGAILTVAALEPDPIVTDLHCPPNCRLCLDACPVKALDGITVNQERCRKHSNLEHLRGWDLYTCSKCRMVCPFSIVSHRLSQI